MCTIVISQHLKGIFGIRPLYWRVDQSCDNILNIQKKNENIMDEDDSLLYIGYIFQENRLKLLN